jgi:hypothetical protein
MTEDHFKGQRLCLDRFLVRLATEFRSETIPRKGFRYSAEESPHFEVYGRVNSEARNGTELYGKKIVLQKILLQQTELRAQQPEFRQNKLSFPSIPSSAE